MAQNSTQLKSVYVDNVQSHIVSIVNALTIGTPSSASLAQADRVARLRAVVRLVPVCESMMYGARQLAQRGSQHRGTPCLGTRLPPLRVVPNARHFLLYPVTHKIRGVRDHL